MRVAAAVVDSRSGELSARRLVGEVDEVVAFCRSLPAPVKVSYEAGPTGFGLARALELEGIECVVAAPGKIPRSAADRVKTDRRDAEKLVRLLMAGGLEAVRVPTVAEEGIRDLVRAREDLRGELMSARHRVSKQLLRYGHRFGGRGWSREHRQWLAAIELEDRFAQLVLDDGIAAIDALAIRRDELERRIAEAIAQSPWAPPAARLQCLRGISTLTAAGLCAEVGDFDRFARAEQFMSYLGLVPSENTTGEKRRLGSITKSGSKHARRLLVEAAWHYRHRPGHNAALQTRQAGQPADVLAISAQAQRRLHRTWTRLERDRGKRSTIVAVAVARELAGFCWAVARTH